MRFWQWSWICLVDVLKEALVVVVAEPFRPPTWQALILWRDMYGLAF